MSQEFGTFVIGEFVRVTDDAFPKLEVRTGAPSAKSSGYVERMEFFPFDRASGRQVLDAAVKAGDVVRVRVTEKAVIFERDGETKAFVSRIAREVVKVAKAA
jgi:hypothetical protein